MESKKHNLFEGILLLSDIDGTLLNSQKKIPQRNIDAIQSFVQRGGLFSLATGRCAQSAKPYAQESGANVPIAVLNGAVIYDFQKENTASQKILPISYKKMINQVHSLFPEIGIEVYVGSDIYIAVSNTVVEKQLLIEHLNCIRSGFDKLPDYSNKILFGGTNNQLVSLRSFLNDYDMDGMYGIFTESHYYEILPPNTHKGTGAQAVADFCGIDAKNVVAVGDYYNDVDMLKTVANPIAAGNAPDEVKKLARYVTGNCENGVVADAIEYLEKIITENGKL